MHPTPRRLLTLTLTALALGACAGDAEVDEGIGEDAAIGATATPAAGTYAYSTWDRDQNQLLDETEFQTVAAERGYTRWNTTADAGLDENEFGAGLFGLWDADDNAQLTEAEWREGAGRWYGADGNYGEYSAWNVNNDGWIDENEFRTGLRETGYWGRWDTDANSMIAENEFGTGLFNTWDTDRNRTIDANEWDLGQGGVDWF